MPALDDAECRRRFDAARHAYLATADGDGVPHVVPVTFAVVAPVSPAASGADGPEAAEVVSAVDHKPKATTELRRLRNLAANPRASVLADVYDDDWSRLWWVRADGVATVDDDGAGRERAVDALVARYAPYREHRPSGPVVRLRVTRWTGWAAQEP